MHECVEAVGALPGGTGELGQLLLELGVAANGVDEPALVEGGHGLGASAAVRRGR